MNESRVKKYEHKDVKKRTEKNKDLYEKITDVSAEYIDINNAVNLDVVKKEGLKRSSYQAVKDFDILEKEEKEFEEKEIKEKKVYDINEILKEAKEKETVDDDKKRIINTEYNILTKLDVDKINSSKDFSKENLKKLIDSIYEKEGSSPKPNKKAKKDDELFKELLATNCNLDEDISKKILVEEKEEKTKEVVKEKSTKEKEEIKDKKEESYSSEELKELIKTDDVTADFSDLEESGTGKIAIIIILVFIILVVGVFLFLKYYGTI